MFTICMNGTRICISSRRLRRRSKSSYHLLNFRILSIIFYITVNVPEILTVDYRALGHSHRSKGLTVDTVHLNTRAELSEAEFKVDENG